MLQPTRITTCPNCADVVEDHPLWFSSITKVYYPEETVKHLEKCPLLQDDVRRAIVIVSATWFARQDKV